MKKTMGFWDIVLMNVVGIVGLRHVAVAATLGASAVSYWFLAAFCFFIPLGMVSAELATAFPDQGGLYVWVRKAFGDRLGFLMSWYYWVNNFFYYPSLLTFIVVTSAFLIDPKLAESKLYVCSMSLVVFWGITLVNSRGLTIGKWLFNLGGLLGTLVPGAILIGLGFLSLIIWKRPCPTDYSLTAMLPQISGLKDISLLSTLMFAMAGIEVTPIVAGETEDPQKTFPRATFISAILIAFIYIVGTASITVMISPEKIGMASGIMDAVKQLSEEFNLAFLLPLMSVCIIVGSFGGISVWVVGPIKMFFECIQEGILPEPITRMNEYGMPGNAMFFQAIFISFVVLVASFLPTVNDYYLVLVMMTTITCFIPYGFMFLAFLSLRHKFPDVERPCRVPGGTPGAYFFTGLGLISVLLAIVLPFFPDELEKTASQLLIYRLQLGAGPVIFGIIGLTLFALKKTPPSQATARPTGENQRRKL